MTNSIMDLYVYLAFAGLVFCIVMLMWTIHTIYKE